MVGVLEIGANYRMQLTAKTLRVSSASDAEC